MDHRPGPGPVQLRGPGQEPGGRGPPGRGPLHDRAGGGRDRGHHPPGRPAPRREATASRVAQLEGRPHALRQGGSSDRRARTASARSSEARSTALPCRPIFAGKFSLPDRTLARHGGYFGGRCAGGPDPCPRLRRDGRLGQCRRHAARPLAHRAVGRGEAPVSDASAFPPTANARRPSLSERRRDRAATSACSAGSPRSRRASRCRSGSPRRH